MNKVLTLKPCLYDQSRDGCLILSGGGTIKRIFKGFKYHLVAKFVIRIFKVPYLYC